MGLRIGRSRWVSFTLGVIFTAFLFTCAEIIVRASTRTPAIHYPMGVAPSKDPLFTYDPDLFWRPKPHFDHRDADYRTNSLGLRGEEFPRTTNQPIFAVLCLGDSPTWGDQVPGDAPYPQVLERLLDSAFADVSVQVLNAGVPCYSSTQSLELLRSLSRQFDFDMVTIANMGSDAFPARRPDSDYVNGPVKSAIERIALRSHLVMWLWVATTEEERRQPRSKEPRVHRVPARPDYEANLNDMVLVAREEGAGVMLIEPFPLCLDGSVPICHREGRERRARRNARFVDNALPDYRSVMREVAVDTEVTRIDLAQIVQASDDPSALYVDHVHPGIEGHRRIAQLLADEIGSRIAAEHTLP